RQARRLRAGWTILEIVFWSQNRRLRRLDNTSHWNCNAGARLPGPPFSMPFGCALCSIVRECSLSVHEYHWSIVGQTGRHTSFGTRGSQVQILPLGPPQKGARAFRSADHIPLLASAPNVIHLYHARNT